MSLSVVQRDGVEPNASGTGLKQCSGRWFVVDERGRVVAPGIEGFRHKALAVEAARAIAKGRS